jgi:hypothetical protein
VTLGATRMDASGDDPDGNLLLFAGPAE